MPDKLAAIEKTLAENDLNTLASLAHQLSGTAGGYGFPAIAEAAKDLEASARTQKDLNRLEGEVREFVSLCRRARARTRKG